MKTRILAAIALAVAVVVAVLVLSGGSDGEAYRVRATFTDAHGLRKNGEVKIGGVRAGTIERLELDAQDRAVVTFRFDAGAGPVGRDARVRSRPVNLLGERYADLDAGDLTKPMADGGSIAVERTGAAVELDDVIDVLDPQTRTGMQVLITEAGAAMFGRGADVRGLLAQMPPTLAESRELLGSIRAQTAELRAAVTAGSRVAASVDGKRDALGQLVDDGGRALAAVAASREALQATITAAAPAVRQLTTTLGTLQGAAQALEPMAQTLRASIPSLRTTLRVLPGVARDAAPAMRAVSATAPDLTRLGREATAPLNAVRGTLHHLSEYAPDLDALTKDLDGEVVQETLRFAHNWSKVIQRADGIGHVFGIHAVLDKELVTSAVSRYIDLDALGLGASRGRSISPAATTRRADPPNRTSGATEGLGGLLRGVLPGISGDAVSSTEGALTTMIDRLQGTR